MSITVKKMDQNMIFIFMYEQKLVVLLIICEEPNKGLELILIVPNRIQNGN